MAKSDSVAEKVKKLLALAEGNQNENERAVAMQFAMDLLAKHNLSIAEVQDFSKEINVVEVEGDFRLERWVKSVLSAACSLYYTDYYISSRFDWWRHTSKEIAVFVGTEENIEVTIEMATWLLNSVRLESNRAFKHSGMRRSFRLGAAGRLFQRAQQMVESETCASSAVSGNNNLMVIRNQLEQANENYLEKLDLKPTRTRTVSVYSSAFVAGQEFGDHLDLATGAGKTTVAGNLPFFK